MVRTIWRPSSARRDESTPRHQGVLSAARSMLTSGRGGRRPSLLSSIRHPPSTIYSNASNPLLPERRELHPSEYRRIAALESLRSRLESSRLRIDEVNPSSILQSDWISDEDEPSQPLTQPPDILAPPTLSPLPSPPNNTVLPSNCKQPIIMFICASLEISWRNRKRTDTQFTWTRNDKRATNYCLNFVQQRPDDQH
jgi:hypothetical protein